jgi:hypothetical protein
MCLEVYILLIKVLTELIKLIIFALTLASCIPPPEPKEGSEAAEEPQPMRARKRSSLRIAIELTRRTETKKWVSLEGSRSWRGRTGADLGRGLRRRRRGLPSLRSGRIDVLPAEDRYSCMWSLCGRYVGSSDSGRKVR